MLKRIFGLVYHECIFRRFTSGEAYIQDSTVFVTYNKSIFTSYMIHIQFVVTLGAETMLRETLGGVGTPIYQQRRLLSSQVC